MKPTALSVVGGSKVRTEYWTYRFNLGPTENGEYHELMCIGMDNVTTKFRKYKLDEMSQEYIDSCSSEQEKQVTLPITVGGSELHLLSGIKNTLHDPLLLKILLSGVGVYLSPFTDIYGSRIIFA